MGACAQIAVFTYAVMRRRPRYEIRLAAFFADNLMNGVAHCGEQPINVERPLRHIYELSAWLVTYGCHKIHELPEHAIHMSRCKVSGCEFSTKSDEWFST